MTAEQKAMITELIKDGTIFEGENYDELEDDADESQFDGLYRYEGREYYSINMGDVFAWACADSEEVTLDELTEAYEYVKTRPDNWNAWIEWVSQRRQAVPQMPVLLDMQRRTPEERANVPWYDKYDTSLRVKFYDLREAVKNGADIEKVKEILNREEEHPFINKK